MGRKTDTDETSSLPSESNLPDGQGAEEEQRVEAASDKSAPGRNYDVESNENENENGGEEAQSNKAAKLPVANAKDSNHGDAKHVTLSAKAGRQKQEKGKKNSLWKSVVSQEEAGFQSNMVTDIEAPPQTELNPEVSHVGAVAVEGIGGVTETWQSFGYDNDILETEENESEVPVVEAVTRDELAAELREQLRSEMQAQVINAESVALADNEASLRSSGRTVGDEPLSLWKKKRFIIPSVVILCAIIGGVLGGVLSTSKDGGDTPDGVTVKGPNVGGGRFGEYVATSRDGSTIAVGAAKGRYVQVFHRNATLWEKIGQNINITSVADHDEFEGDVALNKDGTILAVGVENDGEAARDRGRARVFWYNGIIWNQLGQTLTGSNYEDSFGKHVVLSDDGFSIAVSASLGDPSSDQQNAGYVRVFKYGRDHQKNASEWSQVGPDLTGDEARDQFGTSIALSADGTRLAVGAMREVGQKGRVRVFDFTEDTWNQVGQTFDGDNDKDEADAVALSADGTLLAIGADGDSTNGDIAGLVRVYKIEGSSTWKQIGQDLLGERSKDQFGLDTLSISGECLAVGAKYINVEKGKAYLYRWSGSQWDQILSLSGDRPGDQFGTAAKITGNCSLLVVGAPQRFSSASGYIRIYQVDQLS